MIKMPVASMMLTFTLMFPAGPFEYEQAGGSPDFLPYLNKRLAEYQRFAEEKRYQPTIRVAPTVADVPVLGHLYAQLLSGHNGFVYGAALAVPLTAVVLDRTRFGLRLKAVGENPYAVETAGISVGWLTHSAPILDIGLDAKA